MLDSLTPPSREKPTMTAVIIMTVLLGLSILVIITTEDNE